MKLRLLAATLAALTLTAGIASAQDTSSAKGKLSYALGYQLGREAIESGEALDLNTMAKAVQDGYAKKDPAVPVEQMRDAYQAMQKRQQAKAKAAFDKASAENKTKSDAFLAQNKAKPGRQDDAQRHPVQDPGNRQRPQADPVQHGFAGSRRSVPVGPASQPGQACAEDAGDPGQQDRDGRDPRCPDADAAGVQVGSHPASRTRRLAPTRARRSRQTLRWCSTSSWSASSDASTRSRLRERLCRCVIPAQAGIQ